MLFMIILTLAPGCFFQGDSSSSSLSILNSKIAHAPGTMVTVLNPRSIVKIPVQFQPKDEQLRTSVVLIRWGSSLFYVYVLFYLNLEL